jgi:predicted RNA-binding Zn ribbon-like protein
MGSTDFRFNLGRLSLNFVGTVGSRNSEHPVERWPTVARLAEWLAQSGIARPGDALPALAAADLQRFIALREALHRLVHDVVHHRKPSPGDLAFVNAAAREAHPPVLQLAGARHGTAWEVSIAEPLTVPQVLAIVARDAIDLIGGPDRALLRECAGGTCDGIYVDRSRGFNRVWCASTACGNDTRVKRFRLKAAASH